MKKFYYFTIVLLGLLTVVSCSKDNNDSPAKEAADSYSGASLVAYNGDPSDATKCENASVEVTAIVNTKAKVTLLYCVSGYPSYEMEATVVKTKSESSYSITGTSTKEGSIKVDFSATIVNGVMTATIKNTILASDIAKVWTINTTKEQSFDFLNFKANFKSGKVNMPNSSKTEITTEEFNETVKTWANMFVGIGIAEAKLSLQNDGYVSFSGKSAFATGGSATNPAKIEYKNITKYSYDPSTKVLTFEIPASIFVKAKASDISVPVLYLKFNCSIESGVLTANLDDATVKMLLAIIPTGATLTGYLTKLDTLVPPDYAFFLPVIKGLITDIANALTSSDLTSLVIGGKLAPVK